jgi:hypothetical protein
VKAKDKRLTIDQAIKVHACHENENKGTANRFLPSEKLLWYHGDFGTFPFPQYESKDKEDS